VAATAAGGAFNAAQSNTHRYRRQPLHLERNLVMNAHPSATVMVTGPNAKTATRQVDRTAAGATATATRTVTRQP
jgi:hypothetical protein